MAARNLTRSKMKLDPYGVVYFVGSAESGPIKVGFTMDRTVESRLAQLQTGSHEKLVVLGTVDAGPAVERAIHNILSAHAIRGEWFEREPALALFARLNDTNASPHGKFARRLMRSADVYLFCDHADESIEYKVASDLVFDIARELASVNTDTPLPFRSWLKAQAERDDPTGDLAKDFASSGAFPDVVDLETYLAFVVAKDRPPAVTRTVIEAWIEFDTAVSRLISA